MNATDTITREQLLAAAERLAKSEKELRYLRRFVERAIQNPESENVVEEIAPVTMLLRVRQSYGGCAVLGTFTRQNEKSVWYVPTEGGPEKRIAKKRGASWRGGTPPMPHTEPCRACKDHPESVYGKGRCSIHGSPLIEGLGCETCRST